MTEVLYDKYRPKHFEDVIGQKSAVKALVGLLEGGRSHAFLLSGPSGCGKTTLARISAEHLGCKDIINVNAAVFTGIDAMRTVQESLGYRPLNTSKTKVLILDEAHGLSKNAWDSLLQAIEEPPDYVYWFICSTAPTKIPATIKTRCSNIILKPVNEADLTSLVKSVCLKEKIKVPEFIDLIVKEANGSARKALVNLSDCLKADNRKEASEILKTAVQSEPVIELCRFLLKRGIWPEAMTIINKMEDINPESVRIVVVNYMGAVLKNSKSNKDACNVLSILEAFSQPYVSYENIAPLLISIGRVLFSD